jgi:hypothetical protein
MHRACGAQLVEQCDIPPGMTVGEWRVARAAQRRPAAAPGPGWLRRRVRRALRRH